MHNRRNNGGSGGNLDLDAQDFVINQGAITTSGGDGDSGGTAGYIALYTNVGDVYNTAALSAKGGIGTAGAGGGGNSIGLYPGYRRIYNSGALDTSGGDGTTNAGGSAQEIDFESNNGTAGIVNSGSLTARGGNCTSSNACTGGAGGNLRAWADSDSLVSSGNIDLSGGNGSGYGNAGNGGGVDIEGADGASVINGVYPLLGNITISGNITTKGGNGYNGGTGGDVQILSWPQYIPHGQEIVLLGYTGVNASGGDGDQQGGDGSYYRLGNNMAYYYEYGGSSPSVYGPGGSVVNYANFTADGGNGSQTGGNAGYFDLDTQSDYNFGVDFEQALNFGDVSLIGGNSGVVGSSGPTASGGGYFYLYGMDRAENHGNVVAQGGTGVNIGGNVTTYFPALISPLGAVVNTGNITLQGGDATGSNGNGGSVYTNNSSGTYAPYVLDFAGASVANSGNLTANGGNGGESGTGGRSDGVSLFSFHTPTVNSGTLQAKGGTGANPGQNGTILIDGSDVTNLYQ